MFNPTNQETHLSNELLKHTPASAIDRIAQNMYESLIKAVADVMGITDSNDLADIINRLPQQTKQEYYNLLLQTAIDNLMGLKVKTARSKSEVADLINKEINMKG